MEEPSQTCNNFLGMNSPSSPSSIHFYSAPSSPTSATGGSSGYESDIGMLLKDKDSNLNFDEFEFETSKKFRYEGVELERSQSFEYLLDDGQPKREEKGEQLIRPQQQQQRGGSLPMMAFADELFCNGLVLPLKLPPRLHGNLSSTASSPRSPSSVLKIQFSRRSKWDDEFDPFVVAMENVREEEKRGRSSVAEVHHRRTRSLSPFRATAPRCSSDSGWKNDHQEQQQHKQTDRFEALKQNQLDLVKPKKSASARWFGRGKKQNEPNKRSKTEIIISPKDPPKHKDFPFGRKARSIKVGQEGGIMKNDDENRRQKMKGFLVKYASFGRENNEVKLKEQISALWKNSSLRKLSFKLKENYGAQSHRKK